MKNKSIKLKSKPREIDAKELKKISDAKIESQSALLSEKIIEYFFEKATTLAESGEYSFIFSYANYEGLIPPFDGLVCLAPNSLKLAAKQVEEIVKNRLSSLGFKVQFWEAGRQHKFIGVYWS
jgi:hypothetical protein